MPARCAFPPRWRCRWSVWWSTGGVAAHAAYLDKFQARHNTKLMGNWHPYNRIDPDQPQANMLFLAGNEGGRGSDEDHFDPASRTEREDGRRVVFQVCDWASDGKSYRLGQFLLKEQDGGYGLLYGVGASFWTALEAVVTDSGGELLTILPTLVKRGFDTSGYPIPNELAASAGVSSARLRPLLERFLATPASHRDSLSP